MVIILRLHTHQFNSGLNLETKFPPLPEALQVIEKPWEVSEFLASGVFQAFPESPQGKWQPGLRLAVELLNLGYPLPWLGFLDDVAQWASNSSPPRPHSTHLHIPATITKFIRPYRDQVIGRLFSDPGCLALKKSLSSQPATEQIRSLAWLLTQWHEAKVWQGKLMVPGQLASLKSQGATTLESKALSLVGNITQEKNISLEKTIKSTISQFSKNIDIYKKQYAEPINSGQSTLQLAQITGLRQIQKAKEVLFNAPPWDTPILNSENHQTESQKLTDDILPVGGYSSISNRGRFESLLPSQLAFWDEKIGDSDLFTYKFARDELWYYSRDENTIRKPALELAFVFYPGITNVTTWNPVYGFQNLTILTAALLKAIEHLENQQESHSFKFRWIFNQSTTKEHGSNGQKNTSLENLLAVCLGIRIKQKIHTIETMTESKIRNDLETQRIGSDLRIVECHPFWDQAIHSQIDNPWILKVVPDNSQFRVLFQNNELTPDYSHKDKKMAWLANLLSFWTQAPLSTIPPYSVQKPFSR